jgi:2-methylfumaryl-CoA isomerase
MDGVRPAARTAADLIMLNVLGNHDGTTALDYTVNCAVGYPSVTGPDRCDRPGQSRLPAWDFLCGSKPRWGRRRAAPS